MFECLKSMKNIKSPGNDGLSKEFYECFRDEIKKTFLASIHRVFLNQELSSSHSWSCIINVRKISTYFKVKRDALQGDPISAYLLILVLEIQIWESLNVNFLYRLW